MKKLKEKLNALKAVVEEIKGETDTLRIGDLQGIAVGLIADIFEPEAIEAVKDIEAKVETTKGHYGDYMALLGQFKGLYRVGFVKALERAGASREGIEGAVLVL